MESGFLSIKKQNADPGPLLIQASAQFEESLILKGPWSPPASMPESDSQGGSESAQVHQGVAPGRPRDTAGRQSREALEGQFHDGA